MTERRTEKWTCPKCGSHLPCRKDDMIICLMTACDYSVPAKRETDKEIPTCAGLRYKYG